jgi:DNA-binding GntR family transcriptional regulator
MVRVTKRRQSAVVGIDAQELMLILAVALVLLGGASSRARRCNSEADMRLWSAKEGV